MDAKIADEINQVMTGALLALRKLVESDATQKLNVLSVTKLFLTGVISTAVDLTELNAPGSAPFIYADVEALAKIGGLRAIRKMQAEQGAINYSVSNIDDDLPTAMNYVGKELSTALFKAMHELPLALRSQEILLRGIEALLCNLLSQKFEHPHDILDSLCEHVHMALDDLQKRRH